MLFLCAFVNCIFHASLIGTSRTLLFNQYILFFLIKKVGLLNLTCLFSLKFGIINTNILTLNMIEMCV